VDSLRIFKLVILVLLFAGFLISAFFIRTGIFLLRLPRLRIVSQVMRGFNGLLRVLLGVGITVEGSTDDLDTGGRFIVSNHLGYLDGIVLASLFPVIFVTKRQVRRWPVIGQLLTLLEIIFIDRENKNDILRVVNRISKTLRKETNVLVFPEGTSTNGEKVLPFQSAFFAGPLMAHAAVVPVTLTYTFIDQQPVSAANRDRIYWYGDMSFAPHLWNLLAASRIEVSVKIHPALETSNLRNDSLNRKQLSQACHDVIAGTKVGNRQATRSVAAIAGRLDRRPL
jgi:1-acyl-sn-glycerol-3-phosphate acyltransferase